MTRKARLLIVDDELDASTGRPGESRRMCYKQLSREFDLVWLENPNELFDISDRSGIDAALVDFVLDEMRIDPRTIFEQLEPHVPIALISKSWSTNFPKLEEIRADFPIAHLFTWDEMETPQGREIVSYWLNAAVRARQGVVSLSIEKDDPLLLIQFSDLQFNADTKNTYAADTEVALQTIQTKWPTPPHFLALVGDITERARPIEYEMAQHWAEHVRDKLSRGRSKVDVLTVPGNHDISRPLAWVPRIDGQNQVLADTPLCPDLEGYAFLPYREFSRRIEPAERWQNRRSYWVSGVYRRAGLILFGLNSSELIDKDALPTRVLNDETLGKLFAELVDLKRDEPSALIVGLLHHPFDRSAESIVNPDLFKRHISPLTGSLVLLTGHIHQQTTIYSADGNDPAILQIGSGTFTLDPLKRPEDSQRGFTMVEFIRSNEVIIGVKVLTHAFLGHRLQLIDTASYSRDPSGQIRRA